MLDLLEAIHTQVNTYKYMIHILNRIRDSFFLKQGDWLNKEGNSEFLLERLKLQ